MERSLPLHSIHESLGADFRTVMGYRLPWCYGDPELEYRRARERVGVLDCSYRGGLSVTGNEAQVLLDRLFSSEISSLKTGEGQLSTLLTPKGKVIGVFNVFQLEEQDYLLLFSEPLEDSFLKTFQKYAFLSDVQVIDDTSERSIFTLLGPRAMDAVEHVLGVKSNIGKGLRRESLEWESDLVAITTTGSAAAERLEVEFPAESAERAWTAMVEACHALDGGPIGDAAAEILRVEEGLPRFGIDYTGDNFPNEAGFEHALTYTKCYVGQEVVARMRTYGHTNRILRGLEIEAARSSELAAALKGANVVGESGEVGRITSSANSPSCGMIALSIIHRQHWNPGEQLTVQASSGDCQAVVRELPFRE